MFRIHSKPQPWLVTLLVGPGKMMWISIASYLLFIIGSVITIFYQDAVNHDDISMLLTFSFLTFYLMNIGILIGCPANTLGAESQRVARPLNRNIYEDARNLLAKYQMFKEWMINITILYKLYFQIFYSFDF